MFVAAPACCSGARFYDIAAFLRTKWPGVGVEFFAFVRVLSDKGVLVLFFLSSRAKVASIDSWTVVMMFSPARVCP